MVTRLRYTTSPKVLIRKSLDLKKVDGKWLVSINKEQGNKEHGAPGEEGDDHTHPDDADMGDEPHEHEGEPAQDSIPAM